MNKQILTLFFKIYKQKVHLCLAKSSSCALIFHDVLFLFMSKNGELEKSSIQRGPNSWEIWLVEVGVVVWIGNYMGFEALAMTI